MIDDGTVENILHTTNTRLTALCPGLPRWAGTRKVKPIWIFQKQMTVSGSGICWAICKSAPRSRQTTTPAHHHSVFLQAGCASCRPTNSVKALKAAYIQQDTFKVTTNQILPNFMEICIFYGKLPVSRPWHCELCYSLIVIQLFHCIEWLMQNMKVCCWESTYSCSLF